MHGPYTRSTLPRYLEPVKTSWRLPMHGPHTCSILPRYLEEVCLRLGTFDAFDCLDEVHETLGSKCENALPKALRTDLDPAGGLAISFSNSY